MQYGNANIPYPQFNSGGGGMSPWQMAGAGAAGLGGLMSIFGGGGKNIGMPNYTNPAEGAMPYLEQIPETMRPYYNPYVNAGRNALSGLTEQYGSLINDPTGLMNKIGATYQQSPGFQSRVGQATNAAMNAAAAGGMTGSPTHQQNVSQMVNDIAGQDYNNYMNQALGQYGLGLQGMGGINQMGYGASTGLADSLASNLLNRANLSYTGQQNMNQYQYQDMLAKLRQQEMDRQSSSGIGGFLGNMAGFLGNFF